jgi:hypothetical protein
MAMISVYHGRKNQGFPKTEWDRMINRLKAIIEGDLKSRLAFYKAFSSVSPWSNTTLGYFYYLSAWMNNEMGGRPFNLCRYLLWTLLSVLSFLVRIWESWTPWSTDSAQKFGQMLKSYEC